jgi:ATP phosphoribosyltransferase regulatory subunit
LIFWPSWVIKKREITLSQQLRVPQGTESFFLEEAEKHRDILRRIEDLYTLWGYQPVQTPMIDFFDSYTNLLDKKRIDESYRMINREGDLLILRSDITLFLARQMALSLNNENLPVRVYYSDSILRYQNHEDISHNEFFQTGCELIGKEGLDGDLEIIMLLHDQLDRGKLPQFRIHIGSRELFRSLLAHFNLQDREKDIAHLLDGRCHDDLIEIMPEEAVNLLFFIGNFKEFKDYCNSLSKDLMDCLSPSLDKFFLLIQQISKMDKSASFRIDLSEIGGQPYYTGFVFQAYMEGADRAVASGGRYDDLFGKFGMNVSSVGFSLLLRKMEKLMDFREKEIPLKIEGEKKDFADSYKEATVLRKSGKRVIIG